MILFEWDFSGTVNQFYKILQDCEPLCRLTRKILENFVKKRMLEIVTTEKSSYEITFQNREELINFYKFMLPDHWKFGETEFLEAIQSVVYPLTLWEGSDVMVIKKLNSSKI